MRDKNILKMADNTLSENKYKKDSYTERFIIIIIKEYRYWDFWLYILPKEPRFCKTYIWRHHNAQTLSCRHLKRKKKRRHLKPLESIIAVLMSWNLIMANLLAESAQTQKKKTFGQFLQNTNLHLFVESKGDRQTEGKKRGKVNYYLKWDFLSVSFTYTYVSTWPLSLSLSLSLSVSLYSSLFLSFFLCFLSLSLSIYIYIYIYLSICFSLFLMHRCTHKL